MQTVDLEKLKKQATNEAVRILESKVSMSADELKKAKLEAYNEAVADAQEIIIVLACKALSNKFKFGYGRLEKFLDQLAIQMNSADIEKERKWLESVGFKLQLSDIGDEVKKVK